MTKRELFALACLVCTVCAAAKTEAETANSTSAPISAVRGAEQHHVVKGRKPGLREYLHQKGRVQDIPKALVIYESLGLTVMCTFMTAAYLIEPTKNGILGPLKYFTDGNRFQQLKEAADRRLGWLSRGLKLDPMRLATSYAECTILRLVLKPVLVPLKLYLTWNGLKLWKSKE